MKKLLIWTMVMTLTISLTTCKSAQVIAIDSIPEGTKAKAEISINRAELAKLQPGEFLRLENGITLFQGVEYLRIEYEVPSQKEVHVVPGKNVDRSQNILQSGEKNTAGIGKKTAPTAQEGTGNVANSPRSNPTPIVGDGNTVTNSPSRQTWLSKLWQNIKDHALMLILLIVLILIIIRFIQKRLHL